MTPLLTFLPLLVDDVSLKVGGITTLLGILGLLGITLVLSIFGLYPDNKFKMLSLLVDNVSLKVGGLITVFGITLDLSIFGL